MPASNARPGFGVKFLIGDGGVGAGVQASVEWGTTTAKIRIKWKVAGTVGNGKNITVVVSGSSYVYTTLSSTAISITVPTTATVAQVISNLYQQANFALYWDADFGASPGDGSGTITARTVTPTAGGTDGTEVFTELAEVVDVPGVGVSHRTDEVTHMSSPNGWAEHIGLGVKEQKSFSLAMNFVANDTAQVGLFQTYIASGAKRNYRIQFTDTNLTRVTFAAIITETDISHPRDSKADISVTVLPSGEPTYSLGA